MKHFPIYAQGICLGVALVFQTGGVWRLQYLRDDRHGPVFTLAEIAQYIANNDTTFVTMLAKLGYVIREIEEYTSCPILRPRHASNHGLTITHENQRNPLLRLVRVDGSPWMADFMLPWYIRGQIVFDNVPQESTMIFTIEDNPVQPTNTVVTLKGSCDLHYCSFTGGDTTLQNVNAAFCKFDKAEVRNHSMHNGYVFGVGDKMRVCS